MLVTRISTILLVFVASCAVLAFKAEPLLFGGEHPVRACHVPIQIIVPDGTTPELGWAAHDAMEFWNSLLGRQAFTMEHSKSKLFVVEVREENAGNPDVLGVARLFPAGPNGSCYTQGGVLIVYDRVRDHAPLRVKRLMAHEFGHTLGLAHNPDSYALMYSKIPRIVWSMGDVTESEIELAIELLELEN